MKKKNIVSLIKYHSEKNETGFRNEAYEIAKDFDANGDGELAEYIMHLLSDVNSFVPQSESFDSSFFEKLTINNNALFLPDAVTQELIGIVNAVTHNIGVNKFLFKGEPGTGKTEAVKQLARILDRELYMVDFAKVVDSKLGQTQRNIGDLFKDMNAYHHPEKLLILFDEFDAIALNRTDANDIREMGRVTSAILKALDSLDERIVVVGTTNLYQFFDKALLRRFDTVINFDQYTNEDLIAIAEKVLESFLVKAKITNRDVRLFRKILKQYKVMPMPGELTNVIKSAVAFSDLSDGYDYLRKLYYMVTNEKTNNLEKLKEQGFTVREIEILSKVSKSSVSRILKGDSNE